MEFDDQPSILRESARTINGIAAFATGATAVVFLWLVIMVGGPFHEGKGEIILIVFLEALMIAIAIYNIVRLIQRRQIIGEDDVLLSDRDAVKLVQYVKHIDAEKELRDLIAKYGPLQYSHVIELERNISARDLQRARQFVRDLPSD
jgi:hypothetical protein